MSRLGSDGGTWSWPWLFRFRRKRSGYIDAGDRAVVENREIVEKAPQIRRDFWRLDRPVEETLLDSSIATFDFLESFFFRLLSLAFLVAFGPEEDVAQFLLLFSTEKERKSTSVSKLTQNVYFL